MFIHVTDVIRGKEAINLRGMKRMRVGETCENLKGGDMCRVGERQGKMRSDVVIHKFLI